MTLSDCIPKDKFDTEAVARAAALGFPAINPILPELLGWMKDLNWPVAADITPLVLEADVVIVPAVRRIFAGDDFTWTYSLIQGLLLEVRSEVWVLIEPDLRKFAEHPSPMQRLDGLDELAHETLLARRN